MLVPGLGLGPEAWAPTADRLGYDGRVLVPCLPGYGHPADGENLHPLALAERLLALVAPTPRRMVLAGHSASCQIAAHAAALAANRVSGLVLVGPTTDPRAASWPALAIRWLRTAGHETPRQVPTLVRQYRRTTLRSILRAMDRARGDRIDHALNRFDGPVLVIRGRHDRICPTDWGRSVADCSPTGSLVTLPRGGHMVPLTHGGLVAPLVDGFLSRVGPAAG